MSATLEPREVLDFWFAAGKEKWFAKDDGFDAEIAKRRLGDLIPDFVFAEAAAMLARDASSVALKSSSLCLAESPSASAREKLAIMPLFWASRSLATSRL